MDMTAAARIARAEEVVRQQRDPDGEYGGLGHPEFGPVASDVVEAFYLQEIERLQRAVLGEDDLPGAVPMQMRRDFAHALELERTSHAAWLRTRDPGDETEMS